MATPWMVQEGDGFVSSWQALPWAAGGHAALAARAEAAGRAQERREADERAERVEARYTAAMMMAMRHASAMGVAWSPNAPWASWPTTEAMAEQIFAEQDRESRRLDFQAARAAGLVHLLNVSPGDMTGEVVLEPVADVAERAVRTELVAARRASVLARVRAAARRALAHTGRPGFPARD